MNPSPFQRRPGQAPRFALGLAGLLAVVPQGLWAADLPEYRLKAAFLYNFAVFTEWPAELGPTLTVCVLGKDPFGEDLDALAGKAVGERHLAVRRVAGPDALADCQILFLASTVVNTLPAVLGQLHGATTLTIADSPVAAAHGAALNMLLINNKVTFEANLTAARNAHLSLSSKLLRLATEVRP